MKHFVETHFTLLLLLSCAAGLFLPGFDRLPSESTVLALALLMFLSCYRLREGGFNTLRWGDILLFYVLRYMALPVALWALARLVAPACAMGVFLLTALPAGVANPAFANIYGGAITPAFAIVILSQMAAPFLIPLQFAWMGGMAAGPSPESLFITMIWCIFIPMGIYGFIRRHHRSAAYFHKNGMFFSLLLVAFVIALAIAKQRAVILHGGPELLAFLAVALFCFAAYIAFGWWIPWGRPNEERITYAACSSFNNAALGVSLALLYFPPPVVLFTAVSEVAWSVLPFMFREFLRRVAK